MGFPYRADQVGSLLRPAALLAARNDPAITRGQLEAIEDTHILDVLKCQKEAGLKIFTDGELRRGSCFWRRPGKWQGLDGSPAFLFRRGSARFAMSRVSRLSPRSREHFRAGATGRDALRGTRKPSACRLSVGQGPSPFVVPVAVSGYGPVPAGRWARTPRATRNSAATSRVAASAPSGNT